MIQFLLQFRKGGLLLATVRMGNPGNACLLRTVVRSIPLPEVTKRLSIFSQTTATKISRACNRYFKKINLENISHSCRLILNGVASCHSNQLTRSRTVSILIHDSTSWCNSKWLSCSLFVNLKYYRLAYRIHCQEQHAVLRIIKKNRMGFSLDTDNGPQTFRRKANCSITSFFFKDCCGWNVVLHLQSNLARWRIAYNLNFSSVKNCDYYERMSRYHLMTLCGLHCKFLIYNGFF